jgi:hypothetical protein
MIGGETICDPPFYQNFVEMKKWILARSQNVRNMIVAASKNVRFNGRDRGKWQLKPIRSIH